MTTSNFEAANSLSSSSRSAMLRRRAIDDRLGVEDFILKESRAPVVGKLAALRKRDRIDEEGEDINRFRHRCLLHWEATSATQMAIIVAAKNAARVSKNQDMSMLSV